jgi:hypothetical protein
MILGTGQTGITLGVGSPIVLDEESSDPTAITNAGQVYTKDVAGVSELFYEDSAGTVTQLTTSGSGLHAVNDATNNGFTTVVTLRHTTTGSPAAGIGARQMYQVENSTGGNASVAAIVGEARVVTAGSESGRVDFYFADGGSLVRAFYTGYNSGAQGAGDIVFDPDAVGIDFVVQSMDGTTAINMISASDNTPLLDFGSTPSGTNGTRFSVTLPTATPTAGQNGLFFNVTPRLTEAGSGTHAIMAGVNIAALTLTGAGGDTTTAATVRIVGAPSGATANYSLWVDAGTSVFDGQVYVSDGDANSPGITWTADTDIGLSRSGTNKFAAVANGGWVCDFSASGFNVNSGNAAWADFLVTGQTVGRVIVNADVSQDNIGIGGSPTAGYLLHINQYGYTSGSPVAFVVTGGSHTTLATTVEANDVLLDIARTVQWAQGNITTQRAVQIEAPTWATATSASTITNGVNVAIDSAPNAGTNVTFTTLSAFRVGSANVTVGPTTAALTYATIRVPAHTASVSGTTQVTSSPGVSALNLGQISINDISDQNVTIDNGATLYIAAAPVATALSTVTLTNAYALWIDAGVVRMDAGLTVNDDANDNDSRFEGTSDANLLYVDAGANNVGVGTATPGTKFEVSGTGDVRLTITGTTIARLVLTDSGAGQSTFFTSDGGTFEFSVAGVTAALFDNSTTAGNTRFLVYDVDNATTERVTVGIADSGGAGYKVLRIPN